MHKLSKNLHKKRLGGYSIVELLIVIAIIGILVTLMYGVIARGKRSARDAVRVDAMETFRSGLDAFYSQYGFYPCGDSEISSPNAGPIYGGGLDTVGGTVDSASSCNEGAGQHTHGFLNGSGGMTFPPSASRCSRGANIGLHSEGLLGTNCPKDPINANVGGIGMGYLYMVNNAQDGYLLATYLEENSELMASDGGVCSGVYEVNVGLPVGYAVPWASGKGLPDNGCPLP